MSNAATAYSDPNDLIDAGRRQLQVAWRRCSRQGTMTQPKWIKLAAALFPGPQHLHSSQIGGLASGKLKDPSPKCLLVIGMVNASLAASQRDAAGNRLYPNVNAPAFPDNLKHLWGGLTPMLDASGQPLGPTELFEVATGIRDLGLDTSRNIPTDAEPLASATVGRHLRLGLAALGHDFLSELPTLKEACPSMEPLLMGRTVAADTLLADLSALGSTINETDADLWALISEALPTPTAA
jgi:hypothetical protein